MAPGCEVIRVEVDERVGGRYRVWHAGAGVPAGGFEAEILELVPLERIPVPDQELQAVSAATSHRCDRMPPARWSVCGRGPRIRDVVRRQEALEDIRRP